MDLVSWIMVCLVGASVIMVILTIISFYKLNKLIKLGFSLIQDRVESNKIDFNISESKLKVDSDARVNKNLKSLGE